MSAIEIFSVIVAAFFAEANRRLHNEQHGIALRSVGDAKDEAKFKAGGAAVLFVFCLAWIAAVFISHFWAWAFP